MPDRAVLIDAALERRGCAAWLRGRIEALLDGHEDRERLTCCHSGCAVCVEDLKAVVNEVEVIMADQTGCRSQAANPSEDPKT